MRKRRNPLDDMLPGRFLSLQQGTLALAVAIALLGFFVLRPRLSSPGETAKVFLDGREILSVPLDESDDYRIDLEEAYGVPVSFQVRGGGIRYVDVTCPDHICEKTGVISTDGQTAVCIPNRVAVVIEAAG